MDMSLYDLMKIKKRGFPEHKARFYLHEVLKGLYHLHKMGLFHRDVKPENILINLPKTHSTLQYSFQERVKLADLGSIRGIYSKPPYTEYISTRWYRAPECLLTKGYYGPKMDIWAAGCVFYELITLTPLFAGSNEIDQLAKIHAILGTPPVRVLNKFTNNRSQNFQNFPKQRGKGLNAVLENLSDNAKNVLRLMLEYDPMKRVTLKRLLEHSYFGSLSRINMRLSDKMSAPIGTKRKQQYSEEYIKDSRKRAIKSFSLCMHSVPKKIKVNSS
ncbi:MAPK/MAK/MRK overlapping kinase-like [Agrilus planipennis]|uniref:MAPK/MAK/MRK overlapping kinase-like n=1 Tax=Agrilus planipennis TaxID=224129 RepID=A0A1W4WSU3_AGRPL|nr:MAPK/MAK/MRK overlapping kinase-like [Agrilus planipennis]